MIIKNTKKIVFDDEGRVENLKKYNILHTEPEVIFEQVAAAAAASSFQVPIALINFVDKNRVWTKADQSGKSGAEVDRGLSLCSLAILDNQITVFKDSMPFIEGEAKMKFYAAASIISEEGYNIGSICIIDKQPRAFSTNELGRLKVIANGITKILMKRAAIILYC